MGGGDPDKTIEDRRGLLRALIRQTPKEALATIERIQSGAIRLEVDAETIRELLKLVRAMTEEQQRIDREARKSALRQFLLGLTLAIPVGLFGSYLAWVLGLS